MKSVRLAYHEFAGNLLFDDHGLTPFFALDSRRKAGDGSQQGGFVDEGERWVATLSYQDSGIVHPGTSTPQGTSWQLQEMKEFRLTIKRHVDEDPVAVGGGEVQQKINAHIAPRWHGMQAEKNDGTRVDINVPEGFKEGINVRFSGSNIRFDRYHPLLQQAFEAVGVKSRYIDNPHPFSNIQDAERYVRLHRDESGPIHARDGPLVQLAHLLQNDRRGYRKLVQNDDDERGRNLPGYYHTVTLGPERVQEAFPEHELAKEIKHYYAREAVSKSKNEALAHPKLGASYQASQNERTLRFDEIEQLNHELTQTVLSVLSAAGLDPSPLKGTGSFFPDAYWSVELTDEQPEPLTLDLSRIRMEQESIVVRYLADGGFSPVEWSAVEQLVTDGGTVSPKEIAEESGHHVDSVYRALNRMGDLVEREYGKVALRSEYVADMVYDAVEEARRAGRRAVETAAKAQHMAERGISETMEEFVAWCARWGVDITNRQDALNIDLGELDPDSDPDPRTHAKGALSMWEAAGQDPARFRMGTLQYRRPGDNSPRTQPVWQVL